MRWSRFPYSIPGQWVTSVCIFSIIIAPFAACNNVVPTVVGPGTVPNVGVLLNSDPSNSVLAAVRSQAGDGVFVYGTLREDGNIGEIQGLVLRGSDNQEASLTLEQGRPKKGVAFDGSFFDVTYEVVSTERFKGSIDTFFAARNERQTVPFDIDIAAATAQFAAIIKQYLQIDVSSAPPQDPAPKNIRVINLDNPLGPKAESRSNFIAGFAAVYLAAFAGAGFLLVALMASIMKFVVDFYVGLLTAAVATSLALVFGPFILMGNILRSVFNLQAFQIDLTLEVPGFNLPPRPR